MNPIVARKNGKTLIQKAIFEYGLTRINMTFTCKDCKQIFPNAKDFVYHVDTCVPYNEDASLQLQNAALFLRDWVHFSQKFEETGTIKGKNLQKLTKNTLDWLKANKLQGTLK